MHIPDQASVGPGQPVAITGAALRFPGASDPWSFHELTVAGRQMFRELAAAGDGKRPPHAGAAVLGAPLAALLDDEFRGLGRDDELTGGITARHVLAAETAAAALADVPPVGRWAAPGRIGVFFAEIPEPGTADVAGWVRRQLRARPAGDPGPAGADGQGTAGRGSRLARASLEDLVLGAADVMGSVHGGVAGHGAGRPGSADRTAGTGASSNGAIVNGVIVNGAIVNGGALASPGTASGQHCSLRAVGAACDALNSGQYDLVLAGGVAKGVGGWARRRGSSTAAGPLRVYDASPTGTLPGEGCGVVVLMRAADARAAEVPAYAEIAGWHYAGTGGSHRAVLAEAYLRAGIDPAGIQLIEGHGAATAADDLAELSALAEVLGRRAGGAAARCALGTVAANIGDTRAAAGVAALLKAAFAMTADIIPPATGCVRPNKLLRGAGAPFRLPAVPEQWPQTPVQLAAVNSLGTAPHPDAPRSGPVHVVLRRERDTARQPGRRRKSVPLSASVGSAENSPA